jgi:hypothetical protein
MNARASDNATAWKIQSIRATSIGELKARGAEVTRDRVLDNLSMTDTDWQVVVTISAPGRTGQDDTVFFVRRIDGVMKMVGLWG